MNSGSAVDLYRYYLPGIALAMLAFGVVRLSSVELSVVVLVAAVLAFGALLYELAAGKRHPCYLVLGNEGFLRDVALRALRGGPRPLG